VFENRDGYRGLVFDYALSLRLLRSKIEGSYRPASRLTGIESLVSRAAIRSANGTLVGSTNIEFPTRERAGARPRAIPLA
jgi:hypothetical protein